MAQNRQSELITRKSYDKTGLRFREHWRQYEETFPALAASRIDQVSLECRNSRVPVELIGLLKSKDVLVGCIDVASNVVEAIRAALPYVPADRLCPFRRLINTKAPPARKRLEP